LASADWEIVNLRLDEMEAEGRAILEEAGVAADRITFERSAELRYVGQGHDVRVSLPDGRLDESRRAEIERRFAEEYTRLYGRTPTGNPVEAMTWRLIARADDAVGASFSAGEGPESTSIEQVERKIYLPEHSAMVAVPVYSRYTLPVGFTCDGPCVIEERESTTVIGGNARVTIDPNRSIVVAITGHK
jgi:N-methylhydantoinase A/oxoprolinase/acetone carboxylase beta subunit